MNPQKWTTQKTSKTFDSALKAESSIAFERLLDRCGKWAVRFCRLAARGQRGVTGLSRTTTV
jgi:hypothetical protein